MKTKTLLVYLQKLNHFVIMKIQQIIFCLLTVSMLASATMAQGNRADFRVVPLPDRIDGIKSADFKNS